MCQSQSDRPVCFIWLAEVEAQLTRISEGARSVLEAARNDDFPDVAREADALKQRVSSLRRRLDGKP